MRTSINRMKFYSVYKLEQSSKHEITQNIFQKYQSDNSEDKHIIVEDNTDNLRSRIHQFLDGMQQIYTKKFKLKMLSQEKTFEIYIRYTSLKYIMQKKKRFQHYIQRQKQVFEMKMKELRYFYILANQTNNSLLKTNALISYRHYVSRTRLTNIERERIRQAIIKKEFSNKQLAYIYSVSLTIIYKEGQKLKNLQKNIQNKKPTELSANIE